MRKVIIAIAAGVLASASVVAAPVLPSVASLPAGAMAPAAGTKLDGASRTGMKHARGSSDLAPAMIGLGVLALAGAGAGIAAATSGGGHSNGGATVSP